jgi:hypothetical protein
MELTKICLHIPNFVKTGQQWRAIYMSTYKRLRDEETWWGTWRLPRLPWLLFMSICWDYVCELRPVHLFISSWYISMGPRRNDTDRGKPKNSWEKRVPLPLCPPHIPHGLTKAQTRASAVKGRRLTASAMARSILVTAVEGKMSNSAEYFLLPSSFSRPSLVFYSVQDYLTEHTNTAQCTASYFSDLRFYIWQENHKE